MKKIIIGLLMIASALSSYGQDVWKDETRPVDERVSDLLSKMTVNEKIDLLRSVSPENKRLGIDKYYHGNEALHGIIRPGRFTVFPQAIALASMWDVDFLYEVACAISDEARGKWNELEQGKLQTSLFTDLLTFWSPTINMARDPRWGRTQETYGEDPFLAGVLGTAFVKGLQGNDPRYLKVVSTPKHFACNNEEHNRFSCNANISEKQLREYYLAAYEACVKEGHAESIMASYTSINGVPSCCNPWLLNKVLREDWGFEGYVVSDCSGVAQIVNSHKFVKTPETAATLAIKAGLDLECGDNIYIGPLMKAYEMGMVSEDDINLAARRILTARMKLGIFDGEKNNPYRKIEPSVIGCQKHQDLAMEAARKSIVLLKNDNRILPINLSKIKSIAVVGNNAAHPEFGGYSGIPTVEPVSVLKGLQDASNNNVKINYVQWKSSSDETDFVEAKYFPEGIKARYFSGMDFNTLRLERNEPYIFFEPANQAPDPNIPVDNMSAIWTGNIVPDVTGEYIFNVKVSGEKLSFYIDGKKINNDTVRLSYMPVKLQAGKSYDLKVEYRLRRDVNAIVSLKWKKPENNMVNNGNNLFAEACAAAAKSDIVVAVMGINRNYEDEGKDRDYLTLPQEQQEFLKAIYKVNRNVVLVVVAGSSMAINWENENLPAIVEAWYGGEFGGAAIADVLLGKYNPAGRLPLTFYKGIEQLPAFDDYDITKGRTYKYFKGEPIYPFGYGLSYTSFDYSNLIVKENESDVTVSFKVRNTGKMAGDEVSQVYVRLKDYEGESPNRELKGFKRISLAKGETKDVSITISKQQLRFWSDEKKCFVQTSLLPEIFVGSSSSDIRLHQK